MEKESRLGEHLIIDAWGAKNLDNVAYIESALIKMADAAGATLINTFFHHFGPNCGVTGVAILAESHISIHTWPEYDYAAFDIFMCGAANIQLAVPVLEQLFTPTRIETSTITRGSFPTIRK